MDRTWLCPTRNSVLGVEREWFSFKMVIVQYATSFRPNSWFRFQDVLSCVQAKVILDILTISLIYYVLNVVVFFFLKFPNSGNRRVFKAFVLT